jgi:hypothetical protein
MRPARTLTVLFVSLALVFSTSARQSSAPVPGVTAASLLQSAFTALAGSNTVTDVTLIGTAERIAGSDDETGAATLQAISGASLLNLSFASGLRSEVRNSTSAVPAGNWSGPDGVSHAIAFHNLLTEPAWFFPTFAVANALSCSTCVVTYVGAETWNGLAVQHLTISQTFSNLSSDTTTFQQLSQIDLYLDASSFLPLAFDLNIHPDDNMLLDIPVEIRFSNYQPVSVAPTSSVQMPFHVQKFLNNGLILDLQFQSISLNTGLSATSFAVPQTQ